MLIVTPRQLAARYRIAAQSAARTKDYDLANELLDRAKELEK